MIRFAALLIATSVFAASVPALADGMPREKRPVATKKIKKNKAVRRNVVSEETVVVEQRDAPPVMLAPGPQPSSIPATPVYVWAPGYWTWSYPMAMHVWVPGMYTRQ
jgi:hypothetical protein